MGLLSCYTEQFRLLLEHAQATPDHGKVSDPSEETLKTRTRVAITPAEQQRFVAGYLAGKSTKQLEQESGRSRTAISAALKQAGVQMRTFRKASPEEIKQMISLYQSGLSLVRVAERVGYSEKTVWERLKKADIQLRSVHGV